MATSDPSSALSIAVSPTLGRTVVTIRGLLETATASSLREKLIELIEGGERDVIIDLRHVGFIDSAGIGVLVGAAKRMRQRGGELVLSAPTESVWKALDLAGVTRSLTITRA